jgi:hypothetical protein
MTKLIASDKAVNTFELYSQTILERSYAIFSCSKDRLVLFENIISLADMASLYPYLKHL